MNVLGAIQVKIDYICCVILITTENNLNSEGKLNKIISLLTHYTTCFPLCTKGANLKTDPCSFPSKYNEWEHSGFKRTQKEL